MNRLDEFTILMNKVYDAARAIHKYESKPRHYGTNELLYMAEMHLLDIIYNNDGITVTELAELAHRTKSAITQTTNKLEKKGLIEKKTNKTYHKEINLTMTEVGIEACKYHIQLDQETYIEALESFKDLKVEDFHMLGDFYEKLAEIVKKNNEK